MRVALCGAGVVGGGVLAILHEMQLNDTFRVTKVLVRDPQKVREGFRLPEGAQYVTDWHDVIADDVDMIVELIGGTDDAYDIISAALRQGKHVVTANKAVVARHMLDLEAQANGPEACFAYEAAVAGGIPIIRCLQQSIVQTDRLMELMGIMNGTTNYILSEMDKGDKTYLRALDEAQRLGYAEENPVADVEGHDARAKLCILARLAFGCYIPESYIPCKGIQRLTSDDFEYAHSLCMTIKLVGVCRLVERSLEAFVYPCLVPCDSDLGKTSGVMNIITMRTVHVGRVSFTGPGAGRYPTANSVVADMCAVEKGTCASTPFMTTLARVPPRPRFPVQVFRTH